MLIPDIPPFAIGLAVRKLRMLTESFRTFHVAVNGGVFIDVKRVLLYRRNCCAFPE